MRHSVVIQDGSTRRPVRAVVIQGISEREAQEVDRSWQPALIALLKRIAVENPSEFDIPEHKHWSWRKKVAAMTTGNAPSEFFALECNNEKQGMMAVTIGQPCRGVDNVGELLVYVDFISTAPWNLAGILRKLNKRPRYRAVGTSLLAIAVEFSKSAGYSGRIGLHALPQAEEYYRDACRMTDLGPDQDHDGLRYFELTEEQAAEFHDKE